ncbi:MAG: hypothetical protein AAB223_05005 [Pseudomonadota bacterium]
MTLEPVSGSYLATKDVPILEAPGIGPALGGTKSKAAAKGKEKAAPSAATAKKVGDLKKGEEVAVFGKSGAWFAVQKGEERLGFVPADSLAPILDGTLAQEIAGAVAAGGHNCRYAIRFEGRTVVEIGPGRLADYSASFACERGSTRMSFEAPMFMSEIPHQGGPKAIYQIALDVLGISPDPDQAFSTILFYDRDKGEVVLETAWPADWLGKGKPSPRRAGDVASALAQAAELTLSSWGPKPWEALAKRER